MKPHETGGIYMGAIDILMMIIHLRKYNHNDHDMLITKSGLTCITLASMMMKLLTCII